MIPQIFTVTSKHIGFSFSVLHFSDVVPELTHDGFPAHLKIASRIVSYVQIGNESMPKIIVNDKIIFIKLRWK